jgi:hypothetical protein
MGFGTAVYGEARDRIPYYKDDWIAAFKSFQAFKRVLASSVFMVFASLAPAITFAAFLNTSTNKQYGTIEVLLSTAVSGLIFAVFAGQPLVIVGVTGPVSIFSEAVFKILDGGLFPGVSATEIFLPFMFWVGVWAALMHIIIAFSGALSLIRCISRFSCEVFGCLIGVIYIYTAFKDIVKVFEDQYIQAALMVSLIAIATFAISIGGSAARSWHVYSKGFRSLVADYAVAFSAVFVTAIYQIQVFNQVEIDLLPVPDKFQPTNGRSSWIVNPLDSNLPTWGIFFAIVPGFILTLLFVFDHSVSSIISQAKEHNLKKPSAYNYDIAVLGVTVFICTLLGIPPTNGLIPQAPLHVRSLAKIKETLEQDPANPMIFVKREKFLYVVEQRVSAFAQSALILLIGTIPAFLKLLACIPIAVLDGLFLYMGVASFVGNQFYERIFVMLMVTDKSKRTAAAPHGWNKVSKADLKASRAFLFASVQLFFLVVIFIVTLTPLGIAFPVFIVLLVPTRLYALPSKRIFGKFAFNEVELEVLDGDEDGHQPLAPDHDGVCADDGEMVIIDSHPEFQVDASKHSELDALDLDPEKPLSELDSFAA